MGVDDPCAVLQVILMVINFANKYFASFYFSSFGKSSTGFAETFSHFW